MSFLILHIETTTKNCSVSLSKEGKMLALKECDDEKYSHAENLHPFIETLLEATQNDFTDLAAIAISKGPGSYTGLRIGTAAAKGLCFALDIPLISVDTLTALAHRLTRDSGVIIPVLDARRMEVYQAVFSAKYQRLEPIRAVVISPETYDSYLSENKVYFIGDAVAKCEKILQHPNAVFIHAYPSAKEMIPLAYQKYRKRNFEDVAYFEPFYLKDFIAGRKSNTDLF